MKATTQLSQKAYFCSLFVCVIAKKTFYAQSYLNCAHKRKLWIEFLTLYTWHFNINTQKEHDFIYFLIFFHRYCKGNVCVRNIFSRSKLLHHYTYPGSTASLTKTKKNSCLSYNKMYSLLYVPLLFLHCSPGSEDVLQEVSKTCRRTERW